MKRYKGKKTDWGEIIIKNCTENPTYNQANLFKVLIQNIN